MKTYAVVMWGELRAIPTIIENFKKNLLEELNADLYVVVQKTGLPIDKNIQLLRNTNKIVYEHMYDKPQNFHSIYPYLGSLGNQDNCINNGNLNICYNWFVIDSLIGDKLENEYEYVILTRSDYNHILPFPDIKKICNGVYGNIVWSFEGCEFGGINMNIRAVPKNLIKKVLTQMNECLNSPENYNIKDKNLNIEQLVAIVYQKYEFILGKMCNTAFITADSKDERTTWADIQYSPTRNVFFKYVVNFENAFQALELYTKLNKRYALKNIRGFPFICIC